jgi:hypothetical protein
MLETIMGGITGLFGSVITSFMNYKTQKLKNEHERAMADIEIRKMDKEKEIMLAETEANMRITEVQTEAQIDIADADVYGKTIALAQKEALSETVHRKLMEGGKFSKAIGASLGFLFGIVDFIRRLIRPSLTIYLVGLTTWITYIAWQVMQAHNADLNANQAERIFNNVTVIVIYLTVSCVTWWFGDRRMAKFLSRLNDGNFKDKRDV